MTPGDESACSVGLEFSGVVKTEEGMAESELAGEPGWLIIGDTWDALAVKNKKYRFSSARITRPTAMTTLILFVFVLSLSAAIGCGSIRPE